MGLSLLAESSIPLIYWDDAFLTASYLINRLPTPFLNNKTPFEILFHKSPNYDFLKVFGCLCYSYLRPDNDHKLIFRSKPCTFLGYSFYHKGYKCLVSDARVYIARHVMFDETKFPFVLLMKSLALSSHSCSSMQNFRTMTYQFPTTTLLPIHNSLSHFSKASSKGNSVSRSQHLNTSNSGSAPSIPLCVDLRFTLFSSHSNSSNFTSSSISSSLESSNHISLLC